MNGPGTESPLLTDEIKQEIEKEAAHYPVRRGACIEGLKILQRRTRWISDQGIRELAEFLEMSPEELDSVATFYNLIYRKPVGRHVILLCDSVSCWMLGCDGLHDSIRNKLGITYGQTTEDGRFTLLPIACLGTCDHAPALMVDEDTHRDLAPDAIEEVLDRYE